MCWERIVIDNHWDGIEISKELIELWFVPAESLIVVDLTFTSAPIKQPIQSSVFSRRLSDVPRWDHKTLKSNEKSLLCWKRVVNKRVNTKKICLTMASMMSMDVFIGGEMRFREKDMFLLWPGDVRRFPKSIWARRCPWVIPYKTQCETTTMMRSLITIAKICLIGISPEQRVAMVLSDARNLCQASCRRATPKLSAERRNIESLKHRFALEDWRVSNVHERYFFPPPTWVKCSAFMMDNLQSLALSHTRASYCHRRDRICKWLSCKKHHSRRWRNRAGKYFSPRKKSRRFIN